MKRKKEAKKEKMVWATPHEFFYRGYATQTTRIGMGYAHRMFILGFLRHAYQSMLCLK